MNSSGVELRQEAGGFCLRIEGQATVELDQRDFVRLARQVTAAAHAIREILEPPFVVRLHAQYNVDGDQQTPLFVEDWAFAELPAAEEFLALALADVEQFACRWPFRLWIPPVPEIEDVGFAEVGSVEQALADFRCCLLANFFEETGSRFWNKHLSPDSRIAIWEALPDSDYAGNLPVDPAEIEVWARDGALLTDETDS